MRVGIHQVRFDFPGAPGSIAPTVRDTVTVAEQVGVSSFSFMDHYFQMDQFAPATDPMLEGYCALGFVAALTTTMRLGLLVTGVTYRHPGLLAKIVATLDVLSGGRAQLGLGAAWYEREHRGLGVAFPPVAERFERLEETLQICGQMWGEDDGPFEGRHYRLAETICSPRPVSSPRPSVRIGGGGERKTLALVARYADACNLFASGTEELGHKLDVLHRHCEAEGRDPAEIEVTMLYPGDPLADPGAFVAEMARYAALGVVEVDLMPLGEPVATLEQLGSQVIAPLAELEAAG